MQDAVEVDDEISPAEVSPELTTHFRALRMWLPLKLCGTDAFVAGLDEKLLLARYFHEQIGKIPRFEVGPTPELSVVTYRYVPETGDPNRFNEALLKAVVRDGRVFLSSTMLDGKFTLRLAVLAFRSHLETIDLALQVLKEKVAELSA
jgi:glutamate/tyrosine decarboxylase-like PLP-dependent enzyme